jgi:hypothetical protein
MLNLHLRHRPAGELPAAWEAGAIEHYLSSVPVELPNGRTAAFTADGVPIEVLDAPERGTGWRKARLPQGIHTYRVEVNGATYTRALEVLARSPEAPRPIVDLASFARSGVGALPPGWDASGVEMIFSPVPEDVPNGRTAAFTVDGVPLDVQPVDVFGVTPMVRRARVPLGVHTYRIASSSGVFTRAIEVPTSAVGAPAALADVRSFARTATTAPLVGVTLTPLVIPQTFPAGPTLTPRFVNQN